MVLRDYQEQAVQSILRDFETVGSTLAVLPTGTGKSLIAAEVIKRLAQSNGEGSTLVVAHREELLNQMRRTIETHAGLGCEFELADSRASEIFPADVLFASVQTLISGRKDARRMHKFSPHNYNLIVVDEVHHGTAASYRAVLDYFKANEDIKVLGITATPERADEEALGQICESVAFDYPIIQAIRDGWLVPIQQQLIDIQTLDFSHIRTTAGDLNLGDLAAVMEEERNLYGICDATMREIGDRKGIMFTVSVKQAELACSILNRYRNNVAQWASGKTPKEDRRRIMRDFSDGRFQILVNCNLVSEGFDVPDAQLLIQARPTKSKLLYQQQLGRIMRPLPGIVDFPLTASNDAITRREAISASAKPVATVIDFVGNAGRHKLVHAVDVLGGKISDKARELAERDLRKSGQAQRVDQLVIEAERKERAERERAEAARKAKLTGRATYTSTFVDALDMFDLITPPYRVWDRTKRLSEKERNILIRQKIDPDRLSYAEGKAVLIECFRRWDNGLATIGQIRVLKRRGLYTKDLTKEQASGLINEIATREGWRKR